MRIDQLSLDEIYYHASAPTGPVRLVQLGQYWTRTHAAGFQPSVLKRQTLNPDLPERERAAHLAVASKALDLGPQIEAAEAMLAMELPDWSASRDSGLTMDQRIQRHANEFMSLQCRLPKGCFLTLVNSARLETTWGEHVDMLRLERLKREQYALTIGHQREAAETDWYRLQSSLARLSGLPRQEVAAAFSIVHDEARVRLADLVRIVNSVEVNAVSLGAEFPRPEATAHAHSRSRDENVGGRAL